MFLLRHDEIAGPVNTVDPEPTRNAELGTALGRALHRPSVFPTPRFGVRLVIGEHANEVMASVRVRPDVLLRAGFTFQDGELESALRSTIH